MFCLDFQQIFQAVELNVLSFLKQLNSLKHSNFLSNQNVLPIHVQKLLKESCRHKTQTYYVIFVRIEFSLIITTYFADFFPFKENQIHDS